MDSFESEFAKRLMKRIDAAHAERSKPILGGLAMNFDDYKAKTEYLKALRDVGTWCEEVRKELTQPDQPPRRR